MITKYYIHHSEGAPTLIKLHTDISINKVRLLTWDKVSLAYTPTTALDYQSERRLHRDHIKHLKSAYGARFELLEAFKTD